MNTVLPELTALYSSRRARVLVALAVLFGLRCWLGGAPDPAELAAVVGTAGSWVVSEGRRRHQSVAVSRRLLATLAVTVGVLVAGALGVRLDPALLAPAAGGVAAWVLSEGARRHQPAEDRRDTQTPLPGPLTGHLGDPP